MTDIVNSAGEFSWMTCGSTDYANRVHDCDADTKHATHGVFSVTGRKTGYDATQEWWVKHPTVQLGKRRRGSTPDPDPGVEISSTLALASKTETVTIPDGEQQTEPVHARDILQQVSEILLDSVLTSSY